MKENKNNNEFLASDFKSEVFYSTLILIKKYMKYENSIR